MLVNSICEKVDRDNYSHNDKPGQFLLSTNKVFNHICLITCLYNMICMHIFMAYSIVAGGPIAFPGFSVTNLPPSTGPLKISIGLDQHLFEHSPILTMVKG